MQAKYFLFPTAALFLHAFAGAATAQTAPAFEMREAESMTTPQTLNAVPLNPKDWPATLFFAAPDGGFCSSTVIGPRTVLAAAHCLKNGAAGLVHVAGASRKLVCNHHPDYPLINIRADVTLCLADADISLPGNAKFETLNQSPAEPALGETVTLLGYGCTDLKTRNRIGALFGGNSSVNRYEGEYTVTMGGVALCFGDSGGGSFTSGDGRRLFGVNSRGDASETSWLTTIATPLITTFIAQWSKDKGTGVCGISLTGGKCRD